MGRKVARLEDHNRTLRVAVSEIRQPNALWLLIGALAVLASVAMVVPMDSDGVNAHPGGAMSAFIIMAVPSAAFMLAMRARIFGIPLAGACIITMVLLNKERNEVFSDENAAYWIAFAATAFLLAAAAVAALGVPLTRVPPCQPPERVPPATSTKCVSADPGCSPPAGLRPGFALPFQPRRSSSAGRQPPCKRQVRGSSPLSGLVGKTW